MNDFETKTRQQFIERAAKAYMEGRYDDAAWFEKQVERHTVKAEPATAEPYPDTEEVFGYNNASASLNHALNVAAQRKASQPAKPVKERCPHYKLIRRFFAIARENGLDTSQTAKARMRHALETAMGRCVNSRSEVSAGEWERLGDLVKAGRLAW